MEKFEIVIPARKHPSVNEQQVVRVSPEAYNALIDIYNESTLSIKEIASLLIVEASKHITYKKED
ncbi:MAG: hypothetical protein MRZ45_09350 [Blautia sp.]|nr:hypothetical protein [Blautia sp.]